MKLEHNMSCMCKQNEAGEVVSLCGAHTAAFRIKRVWAVNWLEAKLNGAQVQWVSLPNLVKELKAILKY